MIVRPPLMVACALAVVVAGVWLGEASGSLLAGPSKPDLAAIILSTAAGLVLGRTAVAKALLAAAGFVLLVSGGLIGARHRREAFNDCVSQGEYIRTALAAYHVSHGKYPAGLSELSLEHLPGSLWLHGPILHYARAGNGYNMAFSDWLVTFTATGSQPFTAQK